jgi:hypothetical protein
MLEALPVMLREGRSEDWAFILDSWRRSFLDAALPMLGLDDSASEALRAGVAARFRDVHQARALRLLQRGSLVVAVAPDAPDIIVGWVAFEGPEAARVLHYVYVKKGEGGTFRRQGLASLLLDTARARGCRYSHHTRAGARLATTYAARYAPEAAE